MTVILSLNPTCNRIGDIVKVERQYVVDCVESKTDESFSFLLPNDLVVGDRVLISLFEGDPQ